MAESQLGKPLNRVEGQQKVTGAALYAADQRPDRLAHGYVVVSSIGNGAIQSMVTTDAENSPGVLAVYTPFRALSLAISTGGLVGENWAPLADKQVRYHGQAIGLVVAETFEQARAAAAVIQVTYAERTVAASLADGLSDAIPAPPGYSGPTDVTVLASGVTSVEEALSSAAVQISATYGQPMLHHAPIEPHAVVAVWAGDQVTVYTGTQTPMGCAQNVASALGITTDQVGVVSPHIGGGFGGKGGTWAHVAMTAAAARAIDRPVKTVLTREQVFTVTGNRSGVRQTVTLGAATDGALVAVKHEAYAGLSSGGGVVEQSVGLVTRNLYQTPNIRMRQLAVTLNTPPGTIMRAPGEASGSFGLECAMDELAVKLDLDPVTLRTRNYATVVPGTESEWSSKHLDECYQVGARTFGWSRRPAKPGSRRDGDWSIGMGMASAILGGLRFATQARVKFRSDGTVAVECAAVDLGTGLRTVVSMVTADALGLDPGKIRPALGDSRFPSYGGAFASSSTASVTAALVSATAAAKTALIRHAVEHQKSPLRGVAETAVTYRGGALVSETREYPFGELLKTTETAEVQAVDGDNPPWGGPTAFDSFGAHFCEVRVNRLTGEPRVTRFTTVVDAGRIINPKTARGQIIGGVLIGIGQALLEGSRLEPETGRIANANLADYLIPVIGDTPAFDVRFLNYPDTAFNPVGARGIGEFGVVGSAAAVANAVYNATGVRVRDLPITLDKLLA